MQQHEQRPGSDDIDHSTDSSPESEPASEATSTRPEIVASEPVDGEASEVSPTSPASKHQTANTGISQDRRPLAKSGEFLLPLILSGVIATIMVVAFVSGFESIFPSAVTPVVAPATTPEPAAPTPPTTNDSNASDARTAPTTTPPAAADDSDDSTPDPDAGSKVPESSDKKTSRLRSAVFSPLLASLVLVAPAEDSSAASATDQPGPFGRLMIFIKFVVLILLGVACGLVALGGLALSLDRPLGSLATAASRMFLAGWLTTLGLLIPAPYIWMLEPLHYILACVIFWVSMKFFFRLSFQQAAMLLGGTMSLLAITAFGSWVVLWAAWG
jgi:hypothetical protein